MPTKNNKRSYIGGTTSEARKKYFNYDKELTQVVTNLATSYGISPALVIDRLAHEGLIDRAIINNNLISTGSVVDVFGPSLFSNNNNSTYNSPYGLLGLDNIYDTYSKGITKTKRPINIEKMTTRNESGEIVNSGKTKNLYDTLELFTAELASRRNQVKEQYPNLTDTELDSATAARYNSTNRYFKQLMNSGEYKTKYPIDVKGVNIPTPTKTDTKYIQDQTHTINMDRAFRTAPKETFIYNDKSWNPKLFMTDGYIDESESPIVKHFLNNYAVQNFTQPNKVNFIQEKYKCGGRRKAQLGLDIREGGIAIPIAPNMYYMKGRSHDNGGIAIGPNNKNGLEVEGGEVIKVGKNDVKVFSSVPLLRGVSPAQLVMGGANPNKVFNAQEEFKDRNRINDDGTTYETGGQKTINISDMPSVFRGQKINGRYVQLGVPPATNKANKLDVNFKQRLSALNDDMKDFIMEGVKYGQQILPKSLRKYYAKGINILNSPGVHDISNAAQKITQVKAILDEKKTGGIYIKPSKRGTFTAAATKHGMGVQEFVTKVLANKEDYSPTMVKKANFAKNASRWKKELGGNYEPKRNEKGQVVLDPNNPDDVKWLHEQQGKRGAKAVHKGQREFIEGTLNRTTPVILGVAAANPITTATSLAGGYLLGEAGEFGGELYKTLTGEDYTREGKVIGQTIGGLAGPIGAKLFGKGATNAWNAYKTNKLNSTQTLVDVPELGLTIRPSIRTNKPKQLNVSNNQKYLPTDVEDLTWKEPKALLETQAQVTRRDLKNFNRWAKLFGYEPVPLRYAETKSIADRHVQDRIKQHNTFLRGVAKPNKLQKQAIEYELAKEGITNPTDYDVYTYMATHSAPTTGAGRADLRPIQVRKHKVGNFNLSKTSDSPIGALYTQGSGRGAAGYAGMGPESGGHRRTGVVVEVARPTNFRPEASYAEWVKENDFNFGNIKSRGFHKKVADRVVETGKAPEGYSLSIEDKQNLFNEIKNEFAARPEPVYETAKHALDYIKNHRPDIVKNITQLDESAFNSLSTDSKRAYNKYLGKLMILNPKTVSFSKEVKKENDRFKNIYRDAVILENKRHKNKYISDIDYNPEDYTQPDYSVLKSTSRNRGNAQQHYIFRAPIGEKILEGRGFYLPTEEEIINATTDHYTLWTPGYSRNTRKFGGIKKFKYGGMIYEINGNVKNALMSARPKAQYGKEKKINNDIKIGDDNLIYKRGIDGNWYTDGTTYEKSKYYMREKPVLSGGKRSDGTIVKPKTKSQSLPELVVTASKPLTKENKDAVESKGYIISGKTENHLTGQRRSANRHPVPDYIGKRPETTNKKEAVKSSTNSTPRKGRAQTKSVSAVDNGPKVTRSPHAYTNYKGETKIASSPYNNVGILKNIAGDSTYDVSQLGSPEYKAAKAKLNTPSTGGGTQAKDGRWVGQYKATNAGDWIGLGSNVLGSLASYFITKNAINKMPDPVKPIMTQAAKLKTRYNIEPQLTNVREAEQMNRAAVRRNTASSNTSLAREQRLVNESRGTRNQLYGQKENIETQLINQDRLNRQSVRMNNVRTYNDYLNRLIATRQTQNQLGISNVNNLISGLTGSVNNILGNIESRRATNNTIRSIAAANPNVDARLIGGFDYYIDPITKKKYNKNQQYVGTING